MRQSGAFLWHRRLWSRFMRSEQYGQI